MKKIIFILICLFAFPLSSFAVSKCNDTFQFAYNVNTNYLINTTGENASFTILITNLTSDMILIDKQTSKVYNKFNATGSSLSINTTRSGSYSFEIYSKICKESMRKISVTLPTYNKYFSDERCKGYESYPLCQRWSGYSGDEKKFQSDLDKIKEAEKNKKDDSAEQVEKTKEKWYEVISEVLITYWWALLLIITAIMGLVYVIRSRRKKNEFDFKL